MSQRILVTGAAGYIGSVLTTMLLDEGHYVTAYDAMIRATGVAPLLHLATNPMLKIIKGDVTDEVAMKAAMDGQDVIIHLAAMNGYPVCERDPVVAKKVNLEATTFIAAKLMPTQKLIFTSTGSTYGPVDVDCVDEDTPQRPNTVYGECKAKSEVEVRKAGGVVIRLSTLFGVSPRLRTDLVVQYFSCIGFHTKKLNIFEKNYMRNFVHVRDAARGLIFAMENYDVMSGQTYLVGDESLNMRKIDLVNKILPKIPGCRMIDDEQKDLEQRNYSYSFKKIKALGYRTKYTIDDGIREVMAVLPAIRREDALQWKNHKEDI